MSFPPRSLSSPQLNKEASGKGGGKDSWTFDLMVTSLILVFSHTFIHLHYFLLGTGDAEKNAVLAVEFKVNPSSGNSDSSFLPISQVIHFSLIIPHCLASPFPSQLSFC